MTGKGNKNYVTTIIVLEHRQTDDHPNKSKYSINQLLATGFLSVRYLFDRIGQ